MNFDGERGGCERLGFEEQWVGCRGEGGRTSEVGLEVLFCATCTSWWVGVLRAGSALEFTDGAFVSCCCQSGFELCDDVIVDRSVLRAEIQ